MISCCFFFPTLSLSLLLTSIKEVAKKPNLVTTFNGDSNLSVFVSRPVAKTFCGQGGSEEAPKGSDLLGGVIR